ncbi:hypothetical protein [Nocardioides sp. URHA0032]|uniref:hypothetical protein n=1 Tax=Nocardioides sp. URHA0032 TaxID=1380388 RepID=UPI0012DFA5E4|nr:hypothetical protein [Nocardioides sp. URHA0032]
MTRYDDEPTSCPMCSVGCKPEDLCDCDIDPLCIRDHRIYHVELRNWGAPGWMGGDVA